MRVAGFCRSGGRDLSSGTFSIDKCLNFGDRCWLPVAVAAGNRRCGSLAHLPNPRRFLPKRKPRPSRRGFFSWKLEPLGVRSHFGTGGGLPNVPYVHHKSIQHTAPAYVGNSLMELFPGYGRSTGGDSIHHQHLSPAAGHIAPSHSSRGPSLRRAALSQRGAFLLPNGEPLVFSSVKSVSPVILPNSHSAPPRAGLFFRAPANNPT